MANGTNQSINSTKFGNTHTGKPATPVAPSKVGNAHPAAHKTHTAGSVDDTDGDSD